MDDKDISEEEEKLRSRTQYYKKDEIMQKECNEYVVAGKRLPKLHSRWIYNRYINAGYSIQGLETAHNFTLHELEEARNTIRKLEDRIAELEMVEALRKASKERH